MSHARNEMTMHFSQDESPFVKEVMGGDNTEPEEDDNRAITASSGPDSERDSQLSGFKSEDLESGAISDCSNKTLK